MKKFIIAACLALVSLGTAFAQEGKQALGIHLTYGTEVESLGIGAKYQYNFTDAVRIEPSINYHFGKDNVDMFDFNANAHYLFNIDRGIQLYPLIGLTYARWHADLGNDVSWNKGYLGVNLGAGADFAIDADWTVNFELKYQLVKDFDQAVINVGVAYNF